MTITVTIPTLPTAPNSGSPSNFNALADAWSAALPGYNSALNSLAGQINIEVGNLNAAAAINHKYTFSTTTTDADPGNGFLRLSNATQNASTVIRADQQDANANVLTAWINTWDDSTSTIKGHLRLQHATDPTKWIIFALTALANPSGYFNLTVTVVASSAASPFANNDPVLLSFVRTGDMSTGGSFTSRAYTAPSTVTFSATPTIDASLSNVFYFSTTMSANMTGITISNPVDGQTINIRFVQDATGGRTVAWTSTVKITGGPNTAANGVSWASLTYVGSASRWEGSWLGVPA